MTHGNQLFREIDFVKGSRSNADGTNDCVRVARLADSVCIRDDKTEFGAPDDVKFFFTATEFDAAQDSIRRGVHDGLAFSVTFDAATQMHIMRSEVPQSDLTDGAALKFTASEIAVFYAAIRDFEFDRDTVTVG